MSSPLVTLNDCSVNFAGVPALRDVSLKVSQGEIVTLIGPNGAGKTTLVRIVLGLQKVSRGSVNRKADLRVGYMPQRIKINESMPLPITDFLQLGGHSSDEVLEALQTVGIGDLYYAPIAEVSGVELQRVLFARAMLRKPELLVLDEPVQGVDIAGQAELYELIGSIRDRLRCGVLMVSHDLNIVMAQTDTVICINRHVCCHGHPDQVSSDPAFLELFGGEYADKLAVYHHRHDHEHDIHGDVIHDVHDDKHAHEASDGPANKPTGSLK